MGIVIALRSRHARASLNDKTSRAGRAANRTKSAAVRPASFAVAVERTVAPHSSGMRFRCHHLLTCAGVAPVSDAHASRVDQSSMTVRKVGKHRSDMDERLRRIVLDSKPKSAREIQVRAGQPVLMSDPITTADYKAGFLGRVKAAREQKFANQTEIAVAMGMTQAVWSKYESRSFLPYWLVDRFCLVCGVSPVWLITARGAGPKWEPVYPSGKTRKRARKPRKAA